MGELLTRYRAGEHEQVWKQLLELNARVREEPLWSEAQDVAKETMCRARSNIEILHKRLREMDYPFTGEICDPYQPPKANIRDAIDAIESAVGPIPLSVRAFAEIVGAVDFRGGYAIVNGHRKYHPDWQGVEFPDPLVFWPLDEVFESDYEEWLERREEVGADEAGLFCLDFAPDAYHKSDVSGGAPYGIVLPNPAADALVENEWNHTTFVNYLRICFRWGGFPGLARNSKIPGETLAYLCSDLLPI